MIGLPCWEQTGLGGPLSSEGYMVIEHGVEAYAHYPIIQEKNQHKIKSMLGYTWSSRPACTLQRNSVSKGKVIEKYEL